MKGRLRDGVHMGFIKVMEIKVKQVLCSHAATFQMGSLNLHDVVYLMWHHMRLQYYVHMWSPMWLLE